MPHENVAELFSPSFYSTRLYLNLRMTHTVISLNCWFPIIYSEAVWSLHGKSHSHSQPTLQLYSCDYTGYILGRSLDMAFRVIPCLKDLFSINYSFPTGLRVSVKVLCFWRSKAVVRFNCCWLQCIAIVTNLSKFCLNLFQHVYWFPLCWRASFPLFRRNYCY